MEWRPISDGCLPELEQVVWLWDGEVVWVGGRTDDVDGWLWANSYGSFYWNSSRGVWDSTDFETDDDYKPTHWMPLPDPPTTEENADES